MKPSADGFAFKQAPMVSDKSIAIFAPGGQKQIWHIAVHGLKDGRLEIMHVKFNCAFVWRPFI
jgi:hypothetical protein